MIKKLFSNKVVQNAGWLVSGKVFQMIISLFVSLLTARYLGPSNYGLINYATAYTAFFFSLCTLGIDSVIVKEIIDNPLAEGKVMGTSIGLKFIASFFSTITIILIVSIADAGEPETIIVVALSSLSVLCNVLDTFTFWFQAKLKAKITAICALIAYAITSAYKVYLVVTGKSVYYFALALSLDYFVLGVSLIISYKMHNGQKVWFSWEYAKQLFGKSHHFILSGLMISIYAQTDKFMLKRMIDSTEIGYYSTAVAICNMWGFIITAIINSMYPTIIEAFNKDKEKFERNNKILYALIFYICVFISVAFTLFAEIIIYILYGKEFLPAAMPLRIITWYSSFSYLGSARNAWVVCHNKQKYLKYVYCISAITNVVLNLCLIPVWGASGAALASLITQITTIMVAPLFIKDLRENTYLIIDAIKLKGLREDIKKIFKK